jgi:hypothetical protein
MLQLSVDLYSALAERKSMAATAHRLQWCRALLLLLLLYGLRLRI